MTMVGNFYFSIFLQLTWKFLCLESERGGSVCWPNNKIIEDVESHVQPRVHPKPAPLNEPWRDMW